MTRCPLCNQPFDEKSADCHSSCAMAKGCSAISCPHCGYEFVEESAIVNLFKKLFRKGVNDRQSKERKD